MDPINVTLVSQWHNEIQTHRTVIWETVKSTECLHTDWRHFKVIIACWNSVPTNSSSASAVYTWV